MTATILVCAACVAAFLVFGGLRAAADTDWLFHLADAPDPDVDLAKSREVPFTVTDCDCPDCNTGPATLDAPHLDPNSCRCAMCRAVVDLVRSLVNDRAWDDAYTTELEGRP